MVVQGSGCVLSLNKMRPEIQIIMWDTRSPQSIVVHLHLSYWISGGNHVNMCGGSWLEPPALIFSDNQRKVVRLELFPSRSGGKEPVEFVWSLCV